MTPRQIAVAVVVQEGRVLVGQRALDAREAPGRAEFPGGKIEPHESAAEAAARECLEETGVAVRVLERVYQAVVRDAHPPARITFHWATPLDPMATPKPPFVWVPIPDLPTRSFPAANAPVLAMLGREPPPEGR